MSNHPSSLSSLPRREALKRLAAAGLAPWLPACARTGPVRQSTGKVVVIGGGYGGATAAKYLRLWSGGTVDVTLVEANPRFTSCPMSNLVLAGSKTLNDLRTTYGGLERWGVRVVHDTALAIDGDKRTVRLAGGPTLPYDRLVVSPGVEFMFERVGGMSRDATARIPHAWKAGEQTVLLRHQLEAMRDGGVVVIAVPLAPYRCPPGPYERACQIGWYLKTRKPRSKVLVLDANPQVVSKGPLFSRVWKEDYPGIVLHRPNAAVAEVHVREKVFVLELGERVAGDVLNLIPPMRAADIARDAGLVTANERWCDIDWTTLESVAVKNVHVLGDATMAAPAMPKSGHMANQHGKVAAAAIIALMSGREPPPPVMVNTCYSFIDDARAIHVSSVHRYDSDKKTMIAVAGAGGVSGGDRAQWTLEGSYAWGWARNIWADMLA